MDESRISEIEMPPPRSIRLNTRLRYYANYMTLVGLFMIFVSLGGLIQIDDLTSPEAIASARRERGKVFEPDPIPMYLSVAVFFIGGAIAFISGIQSAHDSEELLTNGTLIYATITNTEKTGTFKGIPIYTINYIYKDTLGYVHSGHSKQASLEENISLEIGKDVPMLYYTDKPDKHKLLLEM